MPDSLNWKHLVIGADILLFFILQHTLPMEPHSEVPTKLRTNHIADRAL